MFPFPKERGCSPIAVKKCHRGARDYFNVGSRGLRGVPRAGPVGGLRVDDVGSGGVTVPELPDGVGEGDAVDVDGDGEG